MRVTQMLSDRTFLTNLDVLNSSLESVNHQISSGKKLLSLKDSPASSAALTGLRADLARIDQYRANADSGSLHVGVADSALSTVHTLVTTIFTKGSAATSALVDPTGRASLAAEIRSLRDQILSLANSEVQGRYLFAGSRSNAPAFTISGDVVTYQGDQVVNQIDVADGVSVTQNFAGDQVFTAVFDNISQLLTAVDSGNTAGMHAALSGFSSALGGLNTFRVQLGASQNTLTAASDQQDALETSIKIRESNLEDANLAEAVTQLQQIQVALQAALAARTATRQRSLFDYLG